MIKSYIQFNEGIKHLLIGPTEEEVLRDNPNSLLNIPNLTDNRELFELALKKGGDINRNDGFLLHYYSQNGNLEIVKYLIENGADVNISDSIIRTPLVNASRNGHYDVVKYLLDNGAGRDKWGRDKRQALQWAESNINIYNRINDKYNINKTKEYEKIIVLLKISNGEMMNNFKKGE